MLQSKPSDNSGSASQFSMGDALKSANPVQPILDAAGKVTTDVLQQTSSINELAAKFARTIGGSEEFVKLFSQYLANSSQSMTEIADGTVGYIEQARIMNEYMQEFGRSTLISSESMIDLYKNSKVLDVSTKDLISNFASIGKEIPGISEYTKVMANQARLFGVPLSQVADDVIPNLEKLNEFGFNGGIEGLTKMVIQSKRLKLDMSETFQFGKDLFSPEKASQTAAFFQRMGTVNSTLTDAFQLQDVARNRFDDLQTAIADMVSSYLEFDEATGEFKVPASSVDDLHAISDETNISYQNLVRAGGELLKMQSKTNLLNESNLNFNESQIQQLESMAQLLPAKNGEGLSYQVTFTDANGQPVTEEIKNLNAGQKQRLEQFLIDSQNLNKGSQETVNDLFTGQKSFTDQYNQIQKTNEEAIGTAIAATGGPDIINSALSVYQATSAAFINNFSLTNNDFRTFLNGFNANLQGVVTNLSNANLTGAISNLTDATTSLAAFAGTAGLGTLTGALSNLTTSLQGFTGIDFTGFQTQIDTAKTAVENFINSLNIGGGNNNSNPTQLSLPELKLPETQLGPTSENTNKTNVNGKIELVFKSDGSLGQKQIDGIVDALVKTGTAQKIGLGIERAFETRTT